MSESERTDYSMVRNGEYSRSQIGNIERHNERKNQNYENGDILLDRSHLNHYFKKPTGGYLEMFDQMCSENIISTKGLKEDATLMDEFLFDVNTEYFEERGGYDFSLEFFSKAYDYAVEKVGGEQYILSAVLHADERNQEVSERLGRDVFHYHLHVMYVPVVQKEVKWSNRNKDVSKRGKVKEIITQVSHSKKWASHNEVGEDGKKHLVKSYSILQDEFFQYMRDSGYKDVERGVKGSNRKNQRVSEFKANKEKERADNLEILNNEKEKELRFIEKDISQATKKKTKINDIEEIKGKPSLIGNNVTLPTHQFEDLKVAAQQSYAVNKENTKKNKKIEKLTKENNKKDKVISEKDVKIEVLTKDNFNLQSTSQVLKLTKELAEVKEENKGLRHQLERYKLYLSEIFKVKEIKELLEKLGFIEKFNQLFSEKRKERNNDTR